MAIWRSVVGKLWMTIMLLVAFVLCLLGAFLLHYIDMEFSNSAEVKRLFVITGIVGFLLTTFFAFFLSFRITRPLLHLKRAADMITLGEYRTRVAVRSHDEIGQLGHAFNHMGEILDTTIRDLTYEKEHLSRILHSMTDAVVTFDANGVILMCNPQGEAIIEKWRGVVAGAASDLSNRGKIPAPLQNVYESVLEEEKGIVTKLHVGSGVWSVAVTPLYTYDTLQGAVAVLRDVTEEYRLEKLRTDFVANVSHELRTPLSMLQGYSEALLDDIAATPEERRELAQVIYDESLRMGRLVQDLLDLARMETGGSELNGMKIEMLPLLSRVHRKFYALARENGISLVLDTDESGGEPPVLKHADEDRLEQVFTNLMDNAIRHTPAGKTITIRIRPARHGEADYVQVQVEDEGQGIPAEDLPYIFERFYKADKARRRMSDNANNRSGGGTGLGLAIVHNWVKAHGGFVQVESEIGQGTTFTVMLPVEPQSNAVEKSR